MTINSLVDSDTVLALDVGAVNTRAVLFDTVEGRYRFLAAGSAPTTVGAPMQDASEGVRIALDRLRTVSGRTLVGADEQLIRPSSRDGVGVDQVATTFSAGAPLKVVAVGLLDNVSLQSVRRLLKTSYMQIVESINLNDRRSVEAQIDSFLRIRPDVVVIAGGTDNGATRSVLKLVNVVRMALYLLPVNARPEVLYAGNSMLGETVQKQLKKFAPVHISENIRPDLKVEQLGAAEVELARIFKRVHASRMMGMNELDSWSAGNLTPTSTAFGRIIRFLSKVTGDAVLGVDIGGSSTAISAAFGGELRLNVFPQHGIGEGLTGLLNTTKLENVYQWVTQNIEEEYVLDYLYNKRLYPASLPAVPEDLGIEQAAARELIRGAIAKSDSSFPRNIARPAQFNTLPWFSHILVSGGVISHAATPAQSMLTVLDAVQPTGVSRLILDKNALASALGAAAVVNSILAVHVLESNTFLPLGYTICPVGRARMGTPVLQLRIRYDTGQETTYEVKYGTIRTIPLPIGRLAQVQLQPLQRMDVGWGPGKGDWFPKKIMGGIFGLVVDARGRPLEVPRKLEERRNLLKKWYLSLQR